MATNEFPHFFHFKMFGPTLLFTKDTISLFAYTRNTTHTKKAREKDKVRGWLKENSIKTKWRQQTLQCNCNQNNFVIIHYYYFIYLKNNCYLINLLFVFCNYVFI